MDVARKSVAHLF